MRALHRPGSVRDLLRERETLGPTRTHKTKLFIALLKELNNIGEDYARLQMAADGLLTILDAKAILIWDADAEIVHTKQRHYSAGMHEFEQRLRMSRAIPVAGANDSGSLYGGGLVVSPLQWQGRVVGAIAVDREGRVLTPNEELGFLAVTAQLAAIIGMRFRGTLDTTVAKIQMDDAAAVQRSLQPQIPPGHVSGLAIATYTQPAEYVSGDYFDLILLDKNRMGIVVADIQGKGVPAALFGNLLRSTINFLARETPSTASLMGRVNTILHGEMYSLRKLFSMFYAVYDPSVKMLTYTGSGHASPILMRASGKAEQLRADNTLIGVQATQRFTERTLPLAQGDVIAFYTDGLVECRDVSKTAFGEERLINVLGRVRDSSAEGIVQAILSEVSQFSPPPFNDDVTLIVTKVL